MSLFRGQTLVQGNGRHSFQYVPYSSTTILWFAIIFLFIYALYDPTFSTVHTLLTPQVVTFIRIIIKNCLLSKWLGRGKSEGF